MSQNFTQSHRHIQSSTFQATAAGAYNGSMTSTSHRTAIALIGAGPRGASLIERIGAHLHGSGLPEHDIELHVIDPAESGAGRIWRTDQTRELCMNTLSHAVTLFTEPGSTVTGPVRQGPTLYEWSLLALRDGLAAGTTHGDGTDPGSAAAGGTILDESTLAARIAKIPAGNVAGYADFPVRAGLAADYFDELLATLPESHPSRALYGEYLSWCYHRAVALLPASVRVIRHRTAAIGIERAGSRDLVQLADGDTVTADATILATGWMPRSQTSEETRFTEILSTRPDLTWVRPGSPVEQPLDGIAPGTHAIVRGLGMGFFDTMALLTAGRGGRFIESSDAPGGLRYEASGREPILHVTSNRGVPFRAKTLYGSLPPRPEQRFARSIDWSAIRRPINFDRTLWPRVVADAYFDHAEALRTLAPGAVTGTSDELHAAITAAIAAADAEAQREQTSDPATQTDLFAVARRISAAVAAFVPDPSLRFDLEAEMLPVARQHEDPAAFDTWVRERVLNDIHEAELGFDSAVKAGLWSVSAARGLVDVVGSLGGFDAESRSAGYRMVMGVGAMAGSGPPAFRNRQLVALAEQGIVRFIGPRAHIDIDARGFIASSDAVSGSEVIAPALIDAWMHFHSVANTADPLARSLVATGRARSYMISARDGSPVETGAFDLDPATGQLIGTDGSADPRVLVAGIPVDDAVHGTIISPMPGTDPSMLRETTRVARTALDIALAAHVAAAAA